MLLPFYVAIPLYKDKYIRFPTPRYATRRCSTRTQITKKAILVARSLALGGHFYFFYIVLYCIILCL